MGDGLEDRLQVRTQPLAYLEMQGLRLGVERQAAVERDHLGHVRGAPQILEPVGEGALPGMDQNRQHPCCAIETPTVEPPARPGRLGRRLLFGIGHEIGFAQPAGC